MDVMELGPEAVIVIHVGGTYGDRSASAARWVDLEHYAPEIAARFGWLC
jgi:UV DNA damage endonuclease